MPRATHHCVTATLSAAMLVLCYRSHNMRGVLVTTALAAPLALLVGSCHGSAPHSHIPKTAREPSVHPAPVPTSRPCVGPAGTLRPIAGWPDVADNFPPIHLCNADIDGDGETDTVLAHRAAGSWSDGYSLRLALTTVPDPLRVSNVGVFSSFANGSEVSAAVTSNPVLKRNLEMLLFPAQRAAPDPSLSALLTLGERITWVRGAPVLPEPYSLFVDDREQLQRLRENDNVAWLGMEGQEGVVPDAAWIHYRIQDVTLNEVARRENLVLSATRHAVVLSDLARRRHAWIYFYTAGDTKFRFRTVEDAAFVDNKVLVSITRPGGRRCQAEVDLSSASISETCPQ